MTKYESDPTSPVYFLGATGGGYYLRAPANHNLGEFGKMYVLTARRRVRMENQVRRSELRLTTAVRDDPDTRPVLDALEACREAEKRIGSNLLACAALHSRGVDGMISIYLNYEQERHRRPESLIMMHFNTGDYDRSIILKKFFYLTPRSVTTVLKRSAADKGRTLSGVALQWIKGIATHLKASKIELCDAWRGSENKRAITSLSFKDDEPLRARRAARHAENEDDKRILAEDLKKNGFYGMWGFTGRPRGSIMKVEPERMRVLLAAFCDRAHQGTDGN